MNLGKSAGKLAGEEDKGFWNQNDSWVKKIYDMSLSIWVRLLVFFFHGVMIELWTKVLAEVKTKRNLNFAGLVEIMSLLPIQA